MREGLMVFDPDSGKEADFFPWRSKTLESVNAASPIVLGNEIFLSETYEIGSVRLKFENEKLTETWRDTPVQRRQLFRAHWATPIANGNFLFGCSGRNEPDAELRCVDWKKGEVTWTVRTHERSALTQVEDYLLVLFEYGKLVLLKADPTKLTEVATYDFGSMPNPDDGGPLLEAPYGLHRFIPWISLSAWEPTCRMP